MCCEVATSNDTVVRAALSICVSCGSRFWFGTSDQLPAEQTLLLGLQDQSCGPVVVLRARYNRPLNTAICGTALSAGTRSAVLEVVIDDREVHAELEGVHTAQALPL